MVQGFNSVSVNGEFLEGDGVFSKYGSDLIIDSETNSIVNKFESLLRKKVVVKSISFLTVDDEKEVHLTGDFFISRIIDNSVQLIKA